MDNEVAAFETLAPPPEFADNTNENDKTENNKNINNVEFIHLMDKQIAESEYFHEERISQLSSVLTNYTNERNKKSFSHFAFSTPKSSAENKSRIEKFSPLPVFSQKSPSTSKSFNSNTSNFSEKPKNYKPVVSCTRLILQQMALIENLHNKDLLTFTNTFTENMTHMIVATTNDNCLKDHTTKYVLAVAKRIWVVNIDWIKKCIENNCIVDEVILLKNLSSKVIIIFCFKATI